MPKSGQSRKHMARAKKKAGNQQVITTVTQGTDASPAEATSPQTVAHPLTPSTSSSIRVPRSAVMPMVRINVMGELRRIGILTVIILIVLAVLARVLV